MILEKTRLRTLRSVHSYSLAFSWSGAGTIAIAVNNLNVGVVTAQAEEKTDPPIQSEIEGINPGARLFLRTEPAVKPSDAALADKPPAPRLLRHIIKAEQRFREFLVMLKGHDDLSRSGFEVRCRLPVHHWFQADFRSATASATKVSRQPLPVGMDAFGTDLGTHQPEATARCLKCTDAAPWSGQTTCITFRSNVLNS